jgi:hypothetical protein
LIAAQIQLVFCVPACGGDVESRSRPLTDVERNLMVSSSTSVFIFDGKYYFNIEEGLKRKGLRELRKPTNEFPLR